MAGHAEPFTQLPPSRNSPKEELQDVQLLGSYAQPKQILSQGKHS